MIVKIILVITDSRGKSIVFVTDALRAYSLDESVNLLQQGKLESIHSVKTGPGAYLRVNPNMKEDDNLDALSLSAYKLFLSLNDIRYVFSKDGWDAYKRYLILHGRSIEERDGHVIYIDGYPLITREQIIEKLTPHRSIIIDAAKQFSIDPNTLGAMVIDEIARAHPWEEVLDKLGAVFVGMNASAGIAQVAIETARALIVKGYYNPNTSDTKLSKATVANTSRAYLYAYVVQAQHSIYFAAARIRQLIDYWARETDISSRPEIIGTLYSQGLGSPKKNPKATDRGLQIAQEFYLIAQSILQ